MKLSIEAMVAAAVAVAFATLSICAIAQEQSERGSGAATGYGSTNGSELSHMTVQGSNSSLSQRQEGTGGNRILGLY